MPHRGRTTAILLATGAVGVVLLGVVSFRTEIRWFLQSDVERIQGKWKVVSVIHGGQEDHHLRWNGLFFEGQTVTFQHPSQNVMAAYQLVGKQKPPWLDIRSPDGTITQLIYDLERDRLTICSKEAVPSERPTAFESRFGSHDRLYVLQRE